MEKNQLIAEMKKIVGEDNVLCSEEALYAYSYDATPGHIYMPDVVVSPGNVQEVSAIMKFANEHKIPVYPRGSGTNLSAGTAPLKGGIVLLMLRFNKILDLDLENLIAEVEVGVIVQDINDYVAPHGLIYPPDPGTVKTASLGGTICENSGGLRGLKYGITKNYVQGLEVVLANGDIIHTGGKNVKDVSGYDMTKLFTGSEGTLGIVTKAYLKLVPKPEAQASMIAVFNTLEDAGNAVSDIIAAKIIPATMEILDNSSIRTVEDFMHVGLPVDAEAILLLEVDGHPIIVADEKKKVLEVLKKNNAAEVTLAKSAEHKEQLWTARRMALPCLAKLRPTTFVEDATVPRSKLTQFLKIVKKAAKDYNVTIGTFGHAGDGNMHPTIVCDLRDKEEMERVHQAMDVIFRGAVELGGTLSGEHGIGLGKLPWMELQHGKEGMNAMKAIKRALDPNLILNPGKLIGEC
ncbi:MAG: FAD-binding protein [Anaerovibrio sp.]|uniref:FAD-binding oxidoreductase n=1 Tax=Anaerovibrio sp. TaxID=1872532 RepID=UPI0025D85989|nr:FAD-linked oxidase C-terminal domain-containing protein [Anaerovibrio sp.]MCR5176959.1 FAD-binding protein [Anaerovibrio sp.]